MNGFPSAVVIIDWNKSSMEWNRSSMSVLRGDMPDLLMERELAGPIAGLGTESQDAEDFINSVISLAEPHAVAAIVVIKSAEGDAADSWLPLTSCTVPILVVPPWRPVAQFWARQFKTFAVLDSRGEGALRIVHRSNGSGLESISPDANSLAPLLEPRFPSLESLSEADPEQLNEIAAAIAATLEPASRILDLSAVICTGRFFQIFGEAFRKALLNKLGSNGRRAPEVLAGDGRIVCLTGAWDLARNLTEQPGVLVARSRTAARLEIITPRQIRYSTLHPQGYVFDPQSTAIVDAVGARPLLAVVDREIERLYGAETCSYLESKTDCRGLVSIDGREKAKNWEQVQRLCDEAIRLRLPRDAVIVAVGGGVTLDVAGFAASIFRRGLRYVRIPTSLIGLVDVGVGIKHGINIGDKKNIVGTFYPAAVNINDPTFLSTLPKRHLACGIAEIIKIAVVRDEALFSTLEGHVCELLEKHFQGLPIARQILLRAEHLMMRELQGNLFEEDLRRLPDFGHTFSPIIETSSLYSIAHGEAVAVDMLLSTTIAVNKGICEPETLSRLRSLLIAAGLPLTQRFCDADRFMESLESARAHRGGQLNLVVPISLGRAGFIQEVGRNDIEEALDEALCQPAQCQLY